MVSVEWYRVVPNPRKGTWETLHLLGWRLAIGRLAMCKVGNLSQRYICQEHRDATRTFIKTDDVRLIPLA